MNMTDFDLDSFIGTFFEEADEHVASFESSLLGLESSPEDSELMNSAFRAAHSLKGGSSMFGLTNIARFTHELETLLDSVRNGKVPWGRSLATLLFRSVDVLRELLAAKGVTLSEAGEALIRELAAHGEPEEMPAETAAAEPEPESDAFTISFRPHADFLSRGADVVLLLRELDDVAAVLDVRVDSSTLPSLDELEPFTCYLAWTFSVRCSRGSSALREVFEFVDDIADITIEPTKSSARPSRAAAPADRPEAPEAAVHPCSPPSMARPEAAFERALALALPTSLQAPRLPSPSIFVAPLAPDAGAPKASSAKDSLPPRTMSVRPSGAPANVSGEGSTVRIATKKLDKILDILGEVVIARSMIAQGLQKQVQSPALREALVTLERHTRELQDSVMSVRMVPISSVFSRFQRVVRELGPKLGKSVQLVIEGADTEIDRAMVEQLADPLTHLVRNACDHGIEKTEDRLAAGKPEAGTLKLNASHRGGHVVVEITDDGRGLDLERVRAKAISSGLLAPGATPTVEELHMLVFAPGFSTAAAITDVSGRGVGLDVVLKNVQDLGGSIKFTSEPGRGSNIVLQLPLTMAIIDGLLLRVGSDAFVVQLRSVVESLRPTASQIKTVFGKTRVLQFRGGTIPLVALSEVLEVGEGETDPTRGIVVVVESGGQTIGIVVDELVADTQVVVKSLEANYKALEGLAGATVLGDGTIALILDVGALARRASALRGTELRAVA